MPKLNKTITFTEEEVRKLLLHEARKLVEPFALPDNIDVLLTYDGGTKPEILGDSTRDFVLIEVS